MINDSTITRSYLVFKLLADFEGYDFTFAQPLVGDEEVGGNSLGKETFRLALSPDGYPDAGALDAF